MVGSKKGILRRVVHKILLPVRRFHSQDTMLYHLQTYIDTPEAQKSSTHGFLKIQGNRDRTVE